MQENKEFQQLVEQLLVEFKGKRIHAFEFNGQKYWLKQPEKLSGIWRWLKPAPEQILQEEIAQLQLLIDKQAPVPRLCYASEVGFVLEDFGLAVDQYANNPTLNSSDKIAILTDCVDGLYGLHRQGLTHGRPAIRDILWDKCGVKFIDFEEHPHKPLAYLKIRDILVFIHSLCRSKVLTENEIAEVIAYMKQTTDPQVWQEVRQFVAKYKWVYWLLLPFKPIARVDLIAIYGVFEHIH